MSEDNSIEEIFFKFLRGFKYKDSDLDYAVLQKHKSALQILSEIGNSGVMIFDIAQINTVFYSSNFGHLLGYSASDYEESGQLFFGEKIHSEDRLKLSMRGVSILKIFNAFSKEDKLKHKVINEYRMLNAQNKYVRLIEQYQLLELDKTGQMWLLMSIVDVSPDQEEFNGIKSQLINFKTGQTVDIESSKKLEFDLTKREAEILQLVKNGLLSKEISNKLAISLHTVNTHRQRFLEKLGANNSFEAVMFASKYGLIE